MKILVGYDGSNAADKALKLAKKHAKAINATVYVVTSLPGGGSPDKELEEITKGKRGLEYAQGFFDEAAITCETHLLVRGLHAGEDIVKFAKENDVDEIVLGVERTSKVGKLVFGSTAQYVILEAPCPVVTTR